MVLWVEDVGFTVVVLEPIFTQVSIELKKKTTAKAFQGYFQDHMKQCLCRNTCKVSQAGL